MKLRIAICDDEIVLAKALKEKVKELWHDSEIEIYTSGEKLLQSNLQYEIIILDIEMPQISGMDVAKFLGDKGYVGKIIFLTSHKNYIQDAFKVKAFRYLYKPVEEEQLIEALESVEKELQDKSQVITISGEGMITINVADIIYLEAMRNKTFIITKDGELECHKPMKEVFELLGYSEFIQIHKSYVVALRHIKSIEEKKVTLYGVKQAIPLSRRRKIEVQNTYLEYARKNAVYL